ncbi:hypothetical protein GUJ93_ZPchr0013g34975 [Zizania palustris]|uniref:Uncharacterized protein n=1 Tax=Zizania palustris TaxID=103762 RepID=A0A8J6BXY5_ZIZPA|nr:hypothetical protein GUJ93_ZPchr0013g34975 [Zizania palustris]
MIHSAGSPLKPAPPRWDQDAASEVLIQAVWSKTLPQDDPTWGGGDEIPGSNPEGGRVGLPDTIAVVPGESASASMLSPVG